MLYVARITGKVEGCPYVIWRGAHADSREEAKEIICGRLCCQQQFDRWARDDEIVVFTEMNQPRG